MIHRGIAMSIMLFSGQEIIMNKFTMRMKRVSRIIDVEKMDIGKLDGLLVQFRCQIISLVMKNFLNSVQCRFVLDNFFVLIWLLHF